MSYLNKEDIETALSKLYEKEEFSPKTSDGVKTIDAVELKDIVGFYDYLKISGDIRGIPYSTDYDINEVIEYYEKALTKAKPKAWHDEKISDVDTSNWVAKDVYK